MGKEVKVAEVVLGGEGGKRGKHHRPPLGSFSLRKKSNITADKILRAQASRKRSGLEDKMAPGIESKYVAVKDWKLDMTPVREILTAEGLAILAPDRHNLGVCQLSYNDRRKVGLLRAFSPETSVGGRPKGYVPIAAAYAVVATLSLADTERVAKGERPKSPLWPADREVTMQYVRAAREQLSAGSRGTPSEVNNRTDGMLVQEVRTQSISFVVEVPAVASMEDWQERATKEFGISDTL